MARSIDTITVNPADRKFFAPRSGGSAFTPTQNPFSGIPVSAFTAGSIGKANEISLNRLAASLTPTGPDSAGLRSNFNLNRQTQLRDIALRRQELERQLAAGRRDIGQERQEGLRQVVNNALQRGIFNSGIRTFFEQRVNREADEALSDLQERMRIALARLENQRKGTAGQKFVNPAGGGGGLSRDDIQDLFRRLNTINAGSVG